MLYNGFMSRYIFTIATLGVTAVLLGIGVLWFENRDKLKAEPADSISTIAENVQQYQCAEGSWLLVKSAEFEVNVVLSDGRQFRFRQTKKDGIIPQSLEDGRIFLRQEGEGVSLEEYGVTSFQNCQPVVSSPLPSFTP